MLEARKLGVGEGGAKRRDSQSSLLTTHVVVEKCLHFVLKESPEESYKAKKTPGGKKALEQFPYNKTKPEKKGEDTAGQKTAKKRKRNNTVSSRKVC